MDVIAPPGGAPMAAPPGAVVVPVAVAAPQPAAGAAQLDEPNWAKLRLRWAQALVILGFAAAALAMFALNASPTAAAVLGGGACAPRAAEAAALRAASKELLLAAAAQVLGATTAVLFEECTCPCQLFTVFATVLGWMTGYCARDVLRLLVGCHGHVHGDLGVYYWFFFSLLILAWVVGCRISTRGLCTFQQ